MPERFWRFQNATGGKAELILYGDIAERTWWGDEVTPKQFAKDLAALGDVDEIVVRINSGGGDVFAAQTIGNKLEDHPATVTAKLDGLCASAATIVACHCDKVVAARDSAYMVHPVKVGVRGYVDAKQLSQMQDAIRVLRETIVDLYARKTGRSKDEVAGWMDATKWWTATEAMENGFVDELAGEEGQVAVENRDGLLFVNSVGTGLPFDTAPDFVQKRSAPAKGTGSFVNNTPTKAPGKTEKEEQTMHNETEIKTVDDLRRAYPELVDQIEQAAAAAERTRIQDIEEMTVAGSETLAQEAKFKKPVSAADFAKAAMKQAKAQGSDYWKAAKDDAGKSGVEKLGQEPPAEGGDDAIMDEFMDALRDQGGQKQ